MILVGKWWVFWACGVRLFIAGVRQVAQPQFTAAEIFEVKDGAANAIVREVGCGNLAMGTLGLATLAQAGWTVPAAIVGGLYYCFAGIGHVVRGRRNLNKSTALISDLAVFVLLAVFVAVRGL